MTAWTDDRVALVLNEVGPLLDHGEDLLDVVALIEDAEERAPRQKLGLIAAVAAIIVVVGALLAVTPTRDAIADWLGVGRTQIEMPAPGATSRAQEPLQSLDAQARSIGADVAAAVLGRKVPTIPGLEPIDFLTPWEGGVLVVYADDLTLWIQVQAQGVPALRKTLAPGGSLTWLDDLGDGGALISGDHTLTTPGRELRSESVVLWTEGGLELRIEGDLPDSELLVLASSVEFG